MRKILAVAALAAAAACTATAASAVTFAGAYDTGGYWNSNNGGLNIDILNGSGNFSLANLVVGTPQSFNLFEIAAGEPVDVPSNGNDGDTTQHNIHVSFTFTAPQDLPGGGPDGTVNGVTVGVQGGNNDYGQLTWNGPAIVNFGSYGVLTITMQNVNFDTHSTNYDSDNQDNNTGYTNVKATFSLAAPVAGGVPEPASWALMIGGFGMTGAALRRRRTAVAATA